MLTRSIIVFSLVAASSSVHALDNTVSANTTISITIPERVVFQVELDNVERVPIAIKRYQNEVLRIEPDHIANGFVVRPE